MAQTHTRKDQEMRDKNKRSFDIASLREVEQILNDDLGFLKYSTHKRNLPYQVQFLEFQKAIFDRYDIYASVRRSRIGYVIVLIRAGAPAWPRLARPPPDPAARRRGEVGRKSPRHWSRALGIPASLRQGNWIPASAGMTSLANSSHGSRLTTSSFLEVRVNRRSLHIRRAGQ
jgi:hypothetical protein